MCLNKRSCLIPFALATQCDSNDGVTQCGVSILAKERERAGVVGRDASD